MSAQQVIAEETRLIILKELDLQANKSITSEAMRRILLQDWVIDQPREWVEEEFRYLVSMKAIETHQARSVMIAKLTERGEQHLQGLINIPGIQRPSPGGR